MIAISNNEAVIACAILCLLTLAVVVILHKLVVKKSEEVAKQTSSDLFKEKVDFYTRTIDTLVEQLNESNRIIDKAIHYVEHQSVPKEPEVDKLNEFKFTTTGSQFGEISNSNVIESDD